MTKTETDALEFIEKKFSYRFEIVDNSFTYLLRAIEWLNDTCQLLLIEKLKSWNWGLVSDWQSDNDLNSIRNSCNVSLQHSIRSGQNSQSEHYKTKSNRNVSACDTKPDSSNQVSFPHTHTLSLCCTLCCPVAILGHQPRSKTITKTSLDGGGLVVVRTWWPGVTWSCPAGKRLYYTLSLWWTLTGRRQGSVHRPLPPASWPGYLIPGWDTWNN